MERVNPTLEERNRLIPLQVKNQKIKKSKNQKSKVKNQKSKIKNQKSKIKNKKQKTKNKKTQK